MRFLRSFAPSKPPGLAAVLLIVLCAAQSASAAIVHYTTVGTFGSTNSDTTVLALGANASQVKFFNGEDVADINVGENSQMSLGSFAVASISATDVSAFDTFKLVITQDSPLAGGGEFRGELTGTVRLFNSQLVLAFDNLTEFIFPVNYELINLGGGSLADNELGLSFLQPTTLKANVSVVPLPAAAWAGMALFGVLGGAKLRGSRQLA